MVTSAKSIPKHIAIIPDGNRRWAEENNKNPLEGHIAGRERTIELIRKAADLGVKVITFWGFSTENWKRSPEEVTHLMKEVFLGGYKKYLNEFKKMNCRFIHLGRKDRLPKEVAQALADLESETKGVEGFTVCFAIDYGGRDEIKRMIKKVVEAGITAEGVTDDVISGSLDTAGLPDADMIVRTSGESRLSGFMPWQSEYSELFFEESHFPDFTAEKLEKLVEEFSTRSRTFGGNSKKQP